jgi:GcrA cell cycle regulator
VLTLNESMCKFPIGDPTDADFAFCGRGVSGGPYCADHARLAYQPSQAKKRRAAGAPDELRRMLRLAAM